MLEYRVIKFSKDEIISSLVAVKGNRRIAREDVEDISLTDANSWNKDREDISIQLRLRKNGDVVIESVEESELIRALIGFLKALQVPLPMRSSKSLISLPGGYIGLKIQYSEKAS